MVPLSIARRLPPCLALIAMLAIASSDRSAAQPDKTDQICTLSERQTNLAIDSFGRLMPLFKNDRCANCHNKIDPFAPRGHVNIKDELSLYRDRKQLVDLLKNTSDAEIDAVHPSILQLTNSSTPLGQGDRANVMFGKTCLVCHDAPPGETNWRMAPPEDSFHDKDQLHLCKHIHTDDLTDTPAQFSKHMNRDAFIKVGFEGSRGLNEFGQAISEYARKPYTKLPITSPSFIDTTDAVREWIIAQDNKYPPNPECGCRPFHYAFKIDEEWYASLAQGDATYSSNGREHTKIPLKFADDGKFTGEGKVAIMIKHGGGAPGVSCDWTQATDITWKIRGTVSDAGIDIDGVQEFAPKATTITCKTMDGPKSFSNPAMAPRSEPVKLRMPAKVGAKGKEERTRPGIRYLSTLELVEEDK